MNSLPVCPQADSSLWEGGRGERNKGVGTCSTARQCRGRLDAGLSVGAHTGTRCGAHTYTQQQRIHTTASVLPDHKCLVVSAVCCGVLCCAVLKTALCLNPAGAAQASGAHPQPPHHPQVLPGPRCRPLPASRHPRSAPGDRWAPPSVSKAIPSIRLGVRV